MMAMAAIPPNMLPAIVPLLGCSVGCAAVVMVAAVKVLLASFVKAVDVGGGVEEDSAGFEEMKSAFSFGFEERNAAVRSFG